MSQFTVNDLRNKIAVTIDEASILLSISKRSLQEFMAEGSGPIAFRRRPVTFRVSELERWVAAREQSV